MTGAAGQAIAGNGMRRVQDQISTYLLTITIINTFMGLVVGCIMFATGMPNPVLWGGMAGVLTFVPYLGAAVGVGIVSLVALQSFDRPGDAIFPPLLRSPSSSGSSCGTGSGVFPAPSSPCPRSSSSRSFATICLLFRSSEN